MLCLKTRIPCTYKSRKIIFSCCFIPDVSHIKYLSLFIITMMMMKTKEYSQKRQETYKIWALDNAVTFWMLFVLYKIWSFKLTFYCPLFHVWTTSSFAFGHVEKQKMYSASMCITHTWYNWCIRWWVWCSKWNIKMSWDLNLTPLNASKHWLHRQHNFGKKKEIE